MSEESKQRERPAEAADSPGPARLYALLAGAFLALLGVLGFFYDAEFGTGKDFASDDLQGLLNINGWRNVIYIATGLVSLSFASRHPRRTAGALGLFYLVFAIWGFDQTDRDIGSLLDAIPLGNKDNALHVVLGILGLGAALVDGPLPKVPERFRPKRKERSGKAGVRKLKAPTVKLPRRKKSDEPEKGSKAPKADRPENKTTDAGDAGDATEKKPLSTGGSGSRLRGREGLPRAGDA